MRNWLDVAALGCLYLCVAACQSKDTPMPDPAAAIQCRPSADCALALAMAYERAEAPEFKDQPDHYVSSLEGLAFTLVEQRDTARLSPIVDEILALRRAGKQPLDAAALTTLAMLQFEIGRRDAAYATVKQITPASEANAALESLAWRAVESERYDDAVHAFGQLPESQQPAAASTLALRKIDEKNPLAAREIVARMKLDLAKDPRLALMLILESGDPDRYAQAVKLLESMPPPAAFGLLSTVNLPQARTPESLPLLRSHRELFAKNAKPLADDYVCQTLAGNMAAAGGALEADELAAKCTADDRDEFFRDLAASHAVGGHYDAAEAVAKQVRDSQDREEARSWIAQSRVLIDGEKPEVAFQSVRDRFLRYERLMEIAEERTVDGQAADARTALQLALANARQMSEEDGRGECLARVGEAFADIGDVAEATALLGSVDVPASRVNLLASIGAAKAKSGDREGAAAHFTAALALAGDSGFDEEQTQNLIESQAAAGLTTEALAAARAMDGGDGAMSPRLFAQEAAILAMAEKGELDAAFAAARQLPWMRSLVFEGIYKKIRETERSRSANRQ